MEATLLEAKSKNITNLNKLLHNYAFHFFYVIMWFKKNVMFVYDINDWSLKNPYVCFYFRLWTEDTKNCKDGDQNYSENEIWKPEPCRLCVCDKGQVICEEIRCEELMGCEQFIIPEGECCPVCQTFAGARGRIGESYTKRPLEGRRQLDSERELI